MADKFLETGDRASEGGEMNPKRNAKLTVKRRANRIADMKTRIY